MGAAGSSNSAPSSSTAFRGRSEGTFVYGTEGSCCPEYANENIRQRTRTSAFDVGEEPRSQVKYKTNIYRYSGQTSRRDQPARKPLSTAGYISVFILIPWNFTGSKSLRDFHSRGTMVSKTDGAQFVELAFSRLATREFGKRRLFPLFLERTRTNERRGN